MAGCVSTSAWCAARQLGHATAPALRGAFRPAPIAAAAPRVASVPCAASAAGPLAQSRRRLASGSRGFYGGFPGQAPPKGDSEKFYKLLGVEKGAEDIAIKAAYKKQAMEHHPDRGGDEGKFKEISKAYEVLCDPEKRQVYDTYGEAGLEGMEQGGAGGAAHGADPFDLFSQMFGFNAGGRGRPQRPVTPDSNYEMQLTLEELFAGTKRSLSFTRNALCQKCDGLGGQNTSQCGRCKGTGRQVHLQQVGMFVQQTESVCAACGGRGYVIPPGDSCKPCSGRGTTKQKMPLDINIEQGSKDGLEFHFRGQADEARGHDTGDVVIIIRQKPHKTFQRVGDSLAMSKTITLTEALCGVEFSTTFLDGEELIVRSTAGQVIKPGDIMTVVDKGMPRSQGQKSGNLFILFDVVFPTQVEAANQERLAEVLGGKPLSGAPPLGSQQAKKLSSRQMQEVKQSLRAEAHRSSQQGQQQQQQQQCTQQ